MAERGVAMARVLVMACNPSSSTLAQSCMRKALDSGFYSMRNGFLWFQGQAWEDLW